MFIVACIEDGFEFDAFVCDAFEEIKPLIEEMLIDDVFSLEVNGDTQSRFMIYANTEYGQVKFGAVFDAPKYPVRKLKINRDSESESELRAEAENYAEGLRG